MAENRSKSPIFAPEKRFMTGSEAEMRVVRADAGTKKIIGYAAKFGKLSQDLGGFVEKIDPGAFDRCLERCDVRGLKNHNPECLLGRCKSGTMRLATDKIGLRYEIDVPETQLGRDTLTEIERGDLDGSSFSFTHNDSAADWDDSTSPPTRTLRDIRDLFDVGPVTYPAYLDTEASSRSFDQWKHSREQAREAELQAAREHSKRVQRDRVLKLRLRVPTIIGKVRNG